MKCSDAEYLMHDYFNQTIDEYSQKELFSHFSKCKQCKLHFHELKATEHLLKKLPALKAPTSFTSDMMQKLPLKKKENRFLEWSRRHPFAIASVIFLFLFSYSLVSYQVSDNDLRILSGDTNNLIINGHEVVVPQGQQIYGDLVIENGNLNIQGEVTGNVTVVNGELLLASVHNVDGKTEQIDDFIEWIWYQVKNLWYQL